MDVFDLRNRLVEDYQRYTRSFIKIADPRIDAKVTSALEEGALWPDPLLQLNPTFQPGGTIEDLVRRTTGPRSRRPMVSACSRPVKIPARIVRTATRACTSTVPRA